MGITPTRQIRRHTWMDRERIEIKWKSEALEASAKDDDISARRPWHEGPALMTASYNPDTGAFSATTDYRSWQGARPWHLGPSQIDIQYLPEDTRILIMLEYENGRHRLNGPSELTWEWRPYQQQACSLLTCRWNLSGVTFEHKWGFLDAAQAWIDQGYEPESRVTALSNCWKERVIGYKCLPVDHSHHPVWEDLRSAQKAMRLLYRAHETARAHIDAFFDQLPLSP